MSFLAAATIGLGLSGKVYGLVSSGRESKKASRRARAFERKLSELENNRQEVINPYEDVTNTFANLGVATGASQFAAEEADISLSNTLDYLRSTGASAGGATAVAQAALRSKEGISSRIEEQEMRNMELSARGEATRQQLYGTGLQIQFNAQEDRENALLNRYAGLGQEQRRLEAGYKQQLINQFSSLGGDLMSLGGGMFTGQR
jgi:hypothetical protein